MSTLTAARLAGCSLGLALGLVLGTGCNDHPLGGGYDDGPQIDERGISVPVPPPSLTAEPVQRVVIDGDLGISNPEAGTRVFVFDLDGVGQGLFDEVAPDGTFHLEGFELDLTMNCLEVWSEEPGAYGKESVHSFFTASIDVDDQGVVTTQYFNGC